jgi:tetratricopeptide (TPR) repeat protein
LGRIIRSGRGAPIERPDQIAAIKLDGSDPNHYFNRALILEEMEQFDNAIADYTKVINMNPGDATAYFNRGNCLANREEYVEAVKDLYKATELDPSNGTYFRILGNTKYQLNALEGDPCTDWKNAINLGDKKAAFSIKRFCN